MRNTIRAVGVLGAVLAVSLAGLTAAQAAGAMKMAKGAKPAKSLTVVKGMTMKAPARKAGSCGEFMYWKGGKCLDARAKP